MSLLLCADVCGYWSQLVGHDVSGLALPAGTTIIVTHWAWSG